MSIYYGQWLLGGCGFLQFQYGKQMLRESDLSTHSINMEYMKVMQDFITYQRFYKGLSLATVDRYKIHLGRLHKYLIQSLDNQNIAMDEITISHINGFVMDMRETKWSDKRLQNGYYSASTIRKYVVSFITFFYWCYVHDIETVPYDKIQKPKRSYQVPVYLTRDEVIAFWNAPYEVDTNPITQVRNLLIMKLCYYTGIRGQELRELVFSDLLDDDWMTIKGKGGRIRSLKIPKEVQTLAIKLRSMYDSRDPRLFRVKEDKDYVFLATSDNCFGKKISSNTTRDMVKRYRKHLGITKKVTLHSFRHTHATQLLRGGADIREVQHSLGHALLQTTQIYTHIADDAMEKNYNRLKIDHSYKSYDEVDLKAKVDSMVEESLKRYLLAKLK